MTSAAPCMTVEEAYRMFTTHQGFEPLGDVPPDVFGLDGTALDQAEGLQLLAGDVISID